MNSRTLVPWMLGIAFAVTTIAVGFGLTYVLLRLL
jgi:hypothetical protein